MSIIDNTVEATGGCTPYALGVVATTKRENLITRRFNFTPITLLNYSFQRNVMAKSSAQKPGGGEGNYRV